MTKELVENVYGSTLDLSPARKSDTGALLALKGKGVLVEGTGITANSNTGTFLLEKQTVGVFTTEAPAFNGYLSLQQMALGLYDAGAAPGPNFHLLLGEAAESNGSSVPDVGGYDTGKYVLVFGGYDSAVFDLNNTQQYAMRNVGSNGGRRMEAKLNDIVYRWTDSGDTDNSILSAPQTVVIDTTTPYLWLPQKAVDSLTRTAGAVWNDTMDSYVMPRSCDGSDCSASAKSSYFALLDFIFEGTGQKITISFGTYFRLQSLWYDSFSSDNFLILPIRALASDDAPIVFGRSVMAGIHLWVDYDANYFGLKAANETYTKQVIVGWSPETHLPITNQAIIAAPLNSDTSSDLNSTSPSNSNSTQNKPRPIKTIAGISGGIVIFVVVGSILACCWLKRRRRDAARRKHPITQSTLGPSELPNSTVGRKDGEYIKMNELENKNPVGPYPPPPAYPPPPQQQQFPHLQQYPPPPQQPYPPSGVHEMQQPPPAIHEMHGQPGGYNNGVGSQPQPGQVYYEMPSGTGGAGR